MFYKRSENTDYKLIFKCKNVLHQYDIENKIV